MRNERFARRSHLRAYSHANIATATIASKPAAHAARVSDNVEADGACGRLVGTIEAREGVKQSA
jgi:hypothetical protein